VFLCVGEGDRGGGGIKCLYSEQIKGGRDYSIDREEEGG